MANVCFRILQYFIKLIFCSDINYRPVESNLRFVNGHFQTKPHKKTALLERLFILYNLIISLKRGDPFCRKRYLPCLCI